jgi:hypothetical protein
MTEPAAYFSAGPLLNWSNSTGLGLKRAAITGIIINKEVKKRKREKGLTKKALYTIMKP